MHMKIQDGQKIVEIWLTNQEQQDPNVREALQPLYQEYQKRKYLVAVFCSGEQPLYNQTRDLLLYNRRRLAEKEVLIRDEAQ